MSITASFASAMKRMILDLCLKDKKVRGSSRGSFIDSPTTSSKYSWWSNPVKYDQNLHIFEKVRVPKWLYNTVSDRPGNLRALENAQLAIAWTLTWIEYTLYMLSITMASTMEITSPSDNTLKITGSSQEHLICNSFLTLNQWKNTKSVRNVQCSLVVKSELYYISDFQALWLRFRLQTSSAENRSTDNINIPFGPNQNRKRWCKLMVITFLNPRNQHALRQHAVESVLHIDIGIHIPPQRTQDVLPDHSKQPSQSGTASQRTKCPAIFQKWHLQMVHFRIPLGMSGWWWTQILDPCRPKRPQHHKWPNHLQWTQCTKTNQIGP